MQTLERPRIGAAFYQEDVVEVGPKIYNGWLFGGNRTFFVNTTNDDGSRITGIRHSTGSLILQGDFDLDQINLVQRGKLHDYYFRGIPPRFRDLSEEAAFWIRYNLAEQVRNPFTGFYTGWTPLQAREALMSSLVDAVFISPEPFRDLQVLGKAYRFSDRKIGAKIRTMMLRNKNRLIPLD